jgi:hypothetical protein
LVVAIEYVDYDEAYGFFGKVIAKSDVRDLSPAEIDREREEMLRILGGSHASSLLLAREVEEVAAAVWAEVAAATWTEVAPAVGA